MAAQHMRSLCGLCVTVIVFILVSGAQAQAPDERSAADQREAPSGREQNAPKAFHKVFCAERSAAQRFMRVNGTDCSSVCDDAYMDYPCDLQQRLKEGWKITSVSTSSIVINRDPCECSVSGTESVLERD
jgi:hypothetical protein